MLPIPASVREVTLPWLREALDGHFPRVGSFTWHDLGEGVGILGEVSRLSLSFEDGSTGTVICKCASPFPENVFLAQTMGFYQREVNFYRQTAESVDVRTPHCFHGAISDDGARFVLLIEDIAGATMIDQLSGATVGQTEAVFDLLATLHASLWESDRLYGLGWLPPMNNPLYKGARELAAARLPRFLEQWSGRLPDRTLGAVGALIPRYPEFLDWAVSQGAMTMAHTDCRAENYLWPADGGLVMIDFQFLTRFWGAWDIANWLGASLTTEDRRAHQDALVARYHARLVELGVTGYSLDRCWRDIRGSLLVQCFSGVVVNDLDGANERGRQLLEIIYTRNFLTAEDNDAAATVDWF